MLPSCWSGDNIQQLADAGRARWKDENESHNILKRRGYHVDHNFGHGDDNLADVLFTMNVLAFLIHTVQQYAARESAPRDCRCV